MSNKFYESDQVKEEIKGMETLYTELARLSIQFPTMSDELKREHLEKTMTVSYTHLTLPTICSV